MWTRRAFLGTTALAALGGPLISAAPAFGADEYDTLRTRWQTLLTGGSYDPAADPFKTKISWLASDATTYHASMSTSSAPIWSDLPLGSVSGNLTTSLSRLFTLASAYITPNTGLTGNATLLADTLAATDYLVAHYYTATGAAYDNWWDWQIGSPQTLQNIMVLLYSSLGATRIANYNAAVDHYVPDSSVSAYSGTSTGANRMDLCKVLALRGVLGKTSAKLALARDAMSPVFPLVCSGDGFYADGSFIQHGVVPYTGSYGNVLLGDFGALFGLLAGSSWDVTDPNRQLVFDSVATAYAPFLFNGLMMDGVSGRAISRGVSIHDPHLLQNDDHRMGHSVIANILQLADSAPAAQAAQFKGMAKGWLARDYWSPPTSDLAQGIPALARFQTLLADGTVTATTEPVASQVFGSMDRAVHRRPGWALTLSLCSSRTTYYETGNGENLHGWHTGNGMTYWWGDTYGNGQYADAYWPTVDPYRLPGTTVSRIALADAAGGAWGASKPATVFVGGATDGTYSVVGQDTGGLSSTLAAKKSWFCLDDQIVCLGAGISATDGTIVETTVDNRNLGGGTGTQTFTVDGTTQLATMGSSATFSGAGWAQLAGFGGYVFPGGATVKALRESRTHSWSEINTGDTTTPITRGYLTLWFDHGTNPSGASYSELLAEMPRAESAHAALLTDVRDVLRGSAPAARTAPTPLSQQLSPTELRILRYLPTNMSRPEIAGELSVSVNTVNTHVRNIYAKLQATDRSSAVQRARELRLLASGSVR